MDATVDKSDARGFRVPLEDYNSVNNDRAEPIFKSSSPRLDLCISCPLTYEFLAKGDGHRLRSLAPSIAVQKTLPAPAVVAVEPVRGSHDLLLS